MVLVSIMKILEYADWPSHAELKPMLGRKSSQNVVLFEVHTSTLCVFHISHKQTNPERSNCLIIVSSVTLLVLLLCYYL